MVTDKEYLTMAVMAISSVIVFGGVSIAFAFLVQRLRSQLQQALQREKVAATPVPFEGDGDVSL